MTKSQRDYTRDYWFRFYPVRYNSSTLLLQPLADCAYRRLLDRYMIDGRPPPDNDRAIARIIGYSLDEWLAVRPEVHPYFKRRKVAGEWALVHEDCDAEIAWQRNRAEIAHEKGKNGAEAKASKTSNLPSTGTRAAELQLPAEGARGDEIRGERTGSIQPDLSTESHSETPSLIPTSAPSFDFAMFWTFTVRKKAKADAEKAWRAAAKMHPPELIIMAWRRFNESVAGKDPTYIPYPAKWLRACRWEDEPEPVNGALAFLNHVTGKDRSNGYGHIQPRTDYLDQRNADSEGDGAVRAAGAIEDGRGRPPVA